MLDPMEARQLTDRATRVRTRLVELAAKQPVHLGPSLSVTDILVAAYAAQDLATHEIVLSKGHAAAALYFVLAEYEILHVDAHEIGLSGSTRSGHPTNSVPGVRVSTGALGHGLAVGCGMALSALRWGPSRRVTVILGDGELNEGSVWEAAAFAGHSGLRNLIVVVDRNGLQQSGRTEDVLTLEPLEARWSAFGWNAHTIDGHSFEELLLALRSEPLDERPTALIARTLKGKGVSFMEDNLDWHQGQLDVSKLATALAELAGD